MAQIDDVNGSPIPGILQRLRALENAAPQNNMAVGRNGIRVHSGGGITIENGGLSVTGSASVSGFMGVSGTAEITGLLAVSGTTRLTGQTDIWGPLIVTGETDLDGLTTINGDTSVTGILTVTGPLRVTGDTDLDGITNITGNTTVEGDFTVNGPMKTTGTLDVEGVTNLKDDLNVLAGGKIKFGDMTIDPELFGGSLQFNGGGYLSGTTSGPQITGPANNSFLYTRDGLAGMQATDIKLVGDVEVQGNFQISNPGTKTGVTSNVYMEDDGTLRRIF